MFKRIRFLLLPLALMAASQAGDAPAHTESSKDRDQISRIEEDLSREREQFLKFREKEQELLQHLALLEKEIEEKRKSVREIEESKARIKKELNEGQARLAQIENALSEAEGRLGLRLAAFYRYARRGTTRLLTTAPALETLRRRIKYLKAIMQDDLDLMQTMADLQRKYGREMSGVKESLAEWERLERAESSRMAALKQDMDRRVVLLMNIHREKEFYKTAVMELELAAQTLKETLVNLEKKSQEKPAPPLPAGFQDSQGKLPLPLEGKIVRETGQEGTKGILIEARSGAAVKAVFPGRVDYSGPLKGYGEVIVINHGARYFTVSAQLGRRNKASGERVEAGEVIGTLAGSSPLQMARLYFEIRLGAGNLDPVKWLKVH